MIELKNLFAVVASVALVLPGQAAAQIVTDHDGWRTARQPNLCVTITDTSSFTEKRTFGLAGDGPQPFIILDLQLKHYPVLASFHKKSTMVPADVSSQQLGYFKRLQLKVEPQVDGSKLKVFIDADLIPELMLGDTLKFWTDGEFGPVVMTYGDLATGLADYRACQQIRANGQAEITQPRDTPLSELPPLERAKKECDNELAQTAGLVPAINPYVLDGKRYPNACEAVADYAMRKLQRVKPLE